MFIFVPFGPITLVDDIVLKLGSSRISIKQNDVDQVAIKRLLTKVVKIKA